MESIPISKFKATCLAALERVRRTGRPLRITRFGRPVADVVPPAVRRAADKRKLGAMAAEGKIMGDIVSPLDVTWEATDS
jgi:prevent-host-death family protein